MAAPRHRLLSPCWLYQPPRASPAPGLGTYVHYSWSLSWSRKEETIILNIPRLYVMPDGSIAKDFFKDKVPRVHLVDDVRTLHSYRVYIRTPTYAQAPLRLSPTSLARPPLPCTTYAAAIAFASSAAGQYQTHQLHHLTLPRYPTVATYLGEYTCSTSQKDQGDDPPLQPRGERIRALVQKRILDHRHADTHSTRGLHCQRQRLRADSHREVREWVSIRNQNNFAIQFPVPLVPDTLRLLKFACAGFSLTSHIQHSTSAQGAEANQRHQ